MKAILLVLLLFPLLSIAQVSGNKNYSNYNNQIQNKQWQMADVVFRGDTAMIITARVLLNATADQYLVTFALAQEGKTVKETSALMQKRLDGLKAGLDKMGISEKDYYVDYIANSRVYDYNVTQNGSRAEQFEKGFELKQNVIIRFTNLNQLNELVNLGSQFEVYDMVKVDYIVNDASKIYGQLINQVAEIINRKRDLYIKMTNFSLNGTSRVYSENFFSFSPSDQYQNYQAQESSTVSAEYNRNITYIEKRKPNTFYFEGLDHSGFDQVINAATPLVGLQYVLELKIIYDLK